MILSFHFFFKFIEKLAYGHYILSSEIQGSGSSFRFQNLFLEARILSKATKTYTCTRDKICSKKCIKQAIRVYVPTNITFAGDDLVKERSLDWYVEIAHALVLGLTMNGQFDGTDKTIVQRSFESYLACMSVVEFQPNKTRLVILLVIRDSQVLAKLGVVLVRPVLLNFHWNLKELRPD